ncbi:MAG TPA: acetyl-CoA carboxylase biotin carboxyl carrier protein subunit [Longimicrobiaceae bacterium]|nr:acetyl-CoA carboxylase biotin carboxyl carrier protein subunit [Longimicrobiaceae bacterium]
MLYFVTIGNRTIEVDLSGDSLIVDGRKVNAELATVPGTPVRHLLLDGNSFTLMAHSTTRRNEWELSIDGATFMVDAVDERTRAIREMTGAEDGEAEKTILAPMPGLVLRLEVEVGQEVTAGQGLIVVEAMKMENELKAAADGVIARIEVAAGQTVEKGAPLIVME